jgi:hypothetical protein
MGRKRLPLSTSWSSKTTRISLQFSSRHTLLRGYFGFKAEETRQELVLTRRSLQRSPSSTPLHPRLLPITARLNCQNGLQSPGTTPKVNHL